MNRNLIIGIILVVVVGLGYYQFSMKPAQEAATQQAEAKAVADKAVADAKAVTDKAAADAAAAAAATTAAATDAAAATTAAATDAMAVLNPASWDATKVTAMIAAAPMLDDATKKTLTDAVKAAAADPAAIAAVIAQIKTAMKM